MGVAKAVATASCARLVRDRGPVGAPDGVVESERPGGAVCGAEPGHPAGVAQCPALAGALHSRLQHVTVGALDCAAPDRETLLAEQAVLHSLEIPPVVSDQVIERLQGVVASALFHLGGHTPSARR